MPRFAADKLVGYAEALLQASGLTTARARTVAEILVEADKILPVLDGLDEIPEVARRAATRQINAAIGRDRPVVVTCRSAEYDDVLRNGAPVLRQAAVVTNPAIAARIDALVRRAKAWATRRSSMRMSAIGTVPSSSR